MTILLCAFWVSAQDQGGTEKLAKTLVGKKWKTIAVTEFKSGSSPVTINSEDKLKASARQMVFEFNSEDVLKCSGSPYSGGFTSWKVISIEEIEMSKPGKTSKVKIMSFSNERLVIKRENPLMRGVEEEITLVPM